MKKYKNYMASWQDAEGTDYCKLFKIEQSNNTINEEFIKNYVYINFCDSVFSEISIDYMDETIIINKKYFA